VLGPVSVDFSEIAATYDRTRSSPRDVEEFWLPAITRHAAVTERSGLLDVGCGTGRLSVPLSQRCRVVGLDASPEMLAVARSKGGGAAFVRGDALRMPFNDRSFDAALAVLVLHLVPDFRRALAEISRVAGRALLATIDMERRVPHAIDEAFPSFHEIDSRRFPRIPAIVEACRGAGWPRVGTFEGHRRIESTTSEFIERVRGRYVSTLTLIPPAEFDRGLAWLESELPRRGPRYAYDHTVTFVVASR